MLKSNFNSYASAQITGTKQYPDIKGRVSFWQTQKGVLVTAQINGLPYTDSVCPLNQIYGFHIHDNTDYDKSLTDPVSSAAGHFNPNNCSHPYHAGDMPPLFGNNSYAYMSFLTDRFTVSEIIGKIVIIHISPDDFTTQPSGNSGEKIAGGTIQK